MFNLGDFKAGSIITLQFVTSDADGSPIGWDSWGATRIFRGVETDNVVSDSNAAVTNFEDIVDDITELTGQHAIQIDTSQDSSFFAKGNDYHVSVGGTVDGVAVRAIVGTFSIENRSMEEIKGSGFDSATDSLNDIKDAISTNSPPGLRD